MSPAAEFASSRARTRSGGGGGASRSNAGIVNPGSARESRSLPTIAAIVADVSGRYARVMKTLDFLDAHAAAETTPVAPAILAVRGALEAAGRNLVGVADDAMERPWSFRDHEADVRYGVYRGIETIEAAEARIAGALEAGGTRRTAAARRIAPVTTARWHLHGRLIALDEGTFDTVAKTDEWTIRAVLGHIVSGQRSYGAVTAWWASRTVEARLPDSVPEDVIAAIALPEEDVEGAGSLAEIRERIDEVVDHSGVALAGLRDEQLARPARWSGIPVDVDFRIGRWSSHVIEHTIQIEKTLAWLDDRPTEAARIVREIFDAWGSLEARLFPLDPAALEVREAGQRRVSDQLLQLAAELEADSASALAAATA
jgi:DinB superfamily